MKAMDNIEAVAKACAENEKVGFILTPYNKWSLCTFPYYQVKYKTLNEFRTIFYMRRKGTLYYFLRVIDKISFGYYRLLYYGP